MSRTSVGTPALRDDEPDGPDGPYGSFDGCSSRRTLILRVLEDVQLYSKRASRGGSEMGNRVQVDRPCGGGDYPLEHRHPPFPFSLVSAFCLDHSTFSRQNTSICLSESSIMEFQDFDGASNVSRRSVATFSSSIWSDDAVRPRSR